MGEFFVYILKSSLCLSVFYLFYKLLLTRETFHSFNRVVLIIIFLLSVLIPFIEISLIKERGISELSLNLDSIIEMFGSVPSQDGAIEGSGRVISWPAIALVIYLTGATVTSVVSAISFIRMSMLLMNKNSRREAVGNGVTLIIHKIEVSPFSWMRYIAINEKDYNENAREILSHEMAHIKCLHSADIIIAEIMRIVHWFNPAAWLLKQEIRNIHEFQADEQVINSGIDAKQYQLLLIKKAVGDRLYTMANSFNHSKLKNRITMITKKKSNRMASLKAMFVLPLTLLAVVVFATEKVNTAMIPISEVKVTDFIQNETTKKISKSVMIVLSGDKASSVNGDIVASVNGDKILFAKGDKVATVNGDKAASINGDIVAFAKGDKADSTKKVKVRMVLNDKDSSKMVYSIASKDSLKSSVIVIDNNKIIKAENKNEIILVTGEMSVVRVTSADDKKLVTGEKSVVRVTSADDQKPLIVVNGEIKKPAFDISNYSPESIQSISVLKGEKALLKYGDKGNNGVIEITLKEGAQIIDVKTEKIVKTKENGNKKEERRELRVRGVSPIIINSSDSVKSEIRIRSTGNFQNPIYVIDGEIMKEGDDINKIKPENIASITVLKDKSAVEKYGEKGKNGVIEVTLKK